ncbi:MAG TPA: hypothetical protein VGN26_12060 [Armatimonadota bacterium]
MADGESFVGTYEIPEYKLNRLQAAVDKLNRIIAKLQVRYPDNSLAPITITQGPVTMKPLPRTEQEIMQTSRPTWLLSTRSPWLGPRRASMAGPSWLAFCMEATTRVAC